MTAYFLIHMPTAEYLHCTLSPSPGQLKSTVRQGISVNYLPAQQAFSQALRKIDIREEKPPSSEII